MLKPVAPCKDCERREVGCHAECPEYQAFRKALDKWNRDAREEEERGVDADKMLIENTLKRKRNATGGKI